MGIGRRAALPEAMVEPTLTNSPADEGRRKGFTWSNCSVDIDGPIKQAK